MPEFVGCTGVLFPPKLIGLRKQTSGIEREHFNLQGLLEYRVGDIVLSHSGWQTHMV